MWMGGQPPLGYDVADRKLIVNPKEAKLVKHIFDRFLALGSLALLATELNQEGHRTKFYVSRSQNAMGGRLFTPNGVMAHVKNRLYLGEVHHRGHYYPGQHQALIERDIFDQAQGIFKENPRVRKKRTWCAKSPALLKGLIVCRGCEGVLSPTYTQKGNKQYHYYIANSYRKHTCDTCPVHRIPAGEVEAVVSGQLKALFASPQVLVEVWNKIRAENPGFRESELHEALNQMGSLWDTLFPAEQKRVMHLLIDRVVVGSQGLDIEYRASGLERIVTDLQQALNHALETRRA